MQYTICLPSELQRSVESARRPPIGVKLRNVCFKFRSSTGSRGMASYLSDAPGHQTFIKQGWETDGEEFKVRLDFGGGIIDFRGLYKNAGA